MLSKKPFWKSGLASVNEDLTKHAKFYMFFGSQKASKFMKHPGKLLEKTASFRQTAENVNASFALKVSSLLNEMIPSHAHYDLEDN